jgi:predicted small lipoprotein YifL
MKRLSAGLVSWSAALLSGCGTDGPLPIPPLDAAAPTRTETATLALG